MAPNHTPYDTWTREQLISRLKQLESSNTKASPKLKQNEIETDSKWFTFASHPTRKIALKFCYSGWEYNGLAHQLGPTPLPTVEGVLFDALALTRLVDPAGGLDGCGWERCGRTDRGVSAAGQVVSLWVRSAHQESNNGATPTAVEDVMVDENDLPALGWRAPPRRKEFNYLSVLNRVLPPTIRVLAWAPIKEDFSARFACRSRHYKYLFSSHGLDISRMRTAAEFLVGEHDFRNLCKLDPGKQITNFRRRILKAEITRIDSSLSSGMSSKIDDEAGRDEVYVFDLVGTAFLYHQVRHIMAILFLVGYSLEPPSIMLSLLNVDPANPNPDHSIEVVECKPEYQMADALPLMLWDCSYHEEDIHWIIDVEGAGEETHAAREKDVVGGTGTELYWQMHDILTRSEVHTMLNAHFLAATEKYHHPLPSTNILSPSERLAQPGILRIPLGGGTFKRTNPGKYVPLLKRNRLDDVAVMNERWRVGTGGRREGRKNVSEAQREELDNGDE